MEYNLCGYRFHSVCLFFNPAYLEYKYQIINIVLFMPFSKSDTHTPILLQIF